MLTRRTALIGSLSALFAPAVIRPGLLMPVKPPLVIARLGYFALPDFDPLIHGLLWNDKGVVKISRAKAPVEFGGIKFA